MKAFLVGGYANLLELDVNPDTQEVTIPRPLPQPYVVADLSSEPPAKPTPLRYALYRRMSHDHEQEYLLFDYVENGAK